MRKYKSNYLKPYVRRIKDNDLKASSRNMDLRTYMRLGMAKEFGFRYVMVQRGAGVIQVGKSKEELKKNILVVDSNKGFNKWTNRIKKQCQR